MISLGHTFTATLLKICVKCPPSKRANNSQKEKISVVQKQTNKQSQTDVCCTEKGLSKADFQVFPPRWMAMLVEYAHRHIHIVVIISHYTQTQNHYIGHLKRTRYMSIISQLKKKRKRKCKDRSNLSP